MLKKRTIFGTHKSERDVLKNRIKNERDVKLAEVHSRRKKNSI